MSFLALLMSLPSSCKLQNENNSNKGALNDMMCYLDHNETFWTILYSQPRENDKEMTVKACEHPEHIFTPSALMKQKVCV